MCRGRGAAVVSARFEEIDWQSTPMGELVLRRRWDPVVEQDVYEIKLGDEFLMSSLFTVAEQELARLGLAELGGQGLDVAVGGLGLGYTAATVLEDSRVRSLVVIDTLAGVIDWHERGLIPSGERLAADPRCTMVHADFFALARASESGPPANRYHAVLVDIDHSPRHLLHPDHADLYGSEGLRCLREHLHPGGVFALWSNDPPDAEFVAALESGFHAVRAEVITFANPLQRREATATVYLATAH
jgi:spermidine synthase